MEALKRLLADDPFSVHGVADYQIIEFTPTMSAPELRSLIPG